MAPSNPFDFSDFGPAAPPNPVARPNPSAPSPGAAGGPPSTGPAGGFDPWAGQPPSTPSPPTGHRDAFGDDSGGQALGSGSAADAFGSTAAAPGPALSTAGPPLIWLAVALALALGGAVLALIGAVAGGIIGSALGGWLLAGPVAIGALAVYNRVDTQRRTESIYSAPGWTSTLYWVVLAACLVGIGVGAWQIASWAGRL